MAYPYNIPDNFNPAGQAVGGASPTAAQVGAGTNQAASGGANWGGLFNGLLGVGANLYQGNADASAAQQFGQQSTAAAQALGQQAMGSSQFKPFAVTTGAGTTQTDATGGFNLGLNPEQQAMQQQLTGQASGLFGNVTGDIGAASQDIYNQIRGIQQPQEQRNQMRLNEELFARGRGGISSAQYGGQGQEQFQYNQAQQEAMNQAAFQARTQALGEQQKQFELGSGLLGQAYVPQQQQLDALTSGTNIANIASTGSRTGAQLQSQLGQTGLEALLRSYESGLTGEQSQRNNLISLLLGSGQGADAVGGLLGGSGDNFGGAVGASLGFGEDNPTPNWIKDIGNDAQGWLSGIFK